jgi:small conductance mechanosensitive channel
MSDLLTQYDWAEWMPVLKTVWRVVLILLLAWFVVVLSQRLIRRTRTYMRRQAQSPELAKRIDTIARVLRYVTAVVVSLVAGTLILSEIGISIAPILGAAGVVGVAVGFGAQSLVKDYFTGFSILLENQIRVGDVVEAGGKSGLVEEITLRYVRLRDYDGNVHFVPNGQITTVSNSSLGFAYSVVEVGVAYREDVDQALDVMRRVGEELRADTAFASRILQELEVAGVERWADSAVILRSRFMVQPLEQWNVRREYLKRLKRAFDEAGIEIPYPHVTVYPGEKKDGAAATFGIAPAAPLSVRLEGP